MAKHAIVDVLNSKWGTSARTIVGAINEHYSVKGKNIADALDKGIESTEEPTDPSDPTEPTTEEPTNPEGN